MDLMEPMQKLDHYVYCNSFFFTSSDLFLNLWENGAVACGTVEQTEKGCIKK